MYELKKGEIINNFSFFMPTHHRTFHISHQPKKRQNKKWQQINYFGHWTSWPSTPKKTATKMTICTIDLFNEMFKGLVEQEKKLKSFCKLQIKIDIEHTKCVTPFLICLFHLFEFLSEKYYSEMSQPLSEYSNTYFT